MFEGFGSRPGCSREGSVDSAGRRFADTGDSVLRLNPALHCRHLDTMCTSAEPWGGLQDPTKKRGYRLAGDVKFDEAKQVAGHITPVPGGVGPMTITMLLSNTLNSAKRAFGAT